MVVLAISHQMRPMAAAHQRDGEVQQRGCISLDLASLLDLMLFRRSSGIVY